MTARTSIVTLAVLCVVVSHAAGAAPVSDVTEGVFIAHHPPGIQFSSGQDWCQKYMDDYAISECASQNCRIDLDGDKGQSSVWYVLAAFSDSTDWCGVAFGLDNYSAEIYGFAEWGPCYPEGGLELPSDEWPAPNEGTSFVTTSTPWSGRILPVYYFAGYAYEEGLLPLGVDPHYEMGGTSSCTMPTVERHAEEFGAMGLFRDGISVYPSDSTTNIPDLLARMKGSPDPYSRGIPDVGWVRDHLQDFSPEMIERLGRSSMAEELGLGQGERIQDAGLSTAPHPTLLVSGSPGNAPQLRFTLTAPASVTLRAFDPNGRAVGTLLEGSLDAGSHVVSRTATGSGIEDLPAGIYTVRLEIDNNVVDQESVIIVR